jgi:SAM-dependent methyltransferase
MPRRKTSPRISRFYRRIGQKGWGGCDYFTFSVRSPELRRWIAAQLPAGRTTVLSIGCGTGELEAHLAARRHRIVGIDLSEAMLRRARGGGLRHAAAADSRALPFRAGRFDAVLFMESIGYLALRAAFAEAARVLRRRGRILVTTYSGEVVPHEGYAKVTSRRIATALAAAGLEVKEQRYLRATRRSVVEVPSESGSTLLYLVAGKPR